MKAFYLNYSFPSENIRQWQSYTAMKTYQFTNGITFEKNNRLTSQMIVFTSFLMASVTYKWSLRCYLSVIGVDYRICGYYGSGSGHKRSKTETKLLVRYFKKQPKNDQRYSTRNLNQISYYVYSMLHVPVIQEDNTTICRCNQCLL